MLKRNIYEALKAEYGTRASWAVWRMPDNTPKSNTSDLSIFSDPQLCNMLHDRYVLVALNRAVHAANAVTDKDWANFHSADNRRQNDYKLRHAVVDTPLWGAYMTDFLEMEETSSTAVAKRVKSDTVWVDACAERLRSQLALLGGHPVLVGIGWQTYNLLRRYFSKEYKIIRIPHYASRQANNKDNYRQIVLAALTE